MTSGSQKTKPAINKRLILLVELLLSVWVALVLWLYLKSFIIPRTIEFLKR
jgi:hypothetical protein